MTTLKKVRLLLAGLIMVLAGMVGTAPPAQAHPNDYTQITIMGVHPLWNCNEAITYFIAPGDGAGNTAQIQSAMSDVATISGYSTVQVYGSFLDPNPTAGIRFQFDGGWPNGVWTDVNLRVYDDYPNQGWQYPGGTIVHLDPNDALSTLTRHEIGHAMGLAHSNSPAQIMYPSVNVADYQDGDRNGLYQINQQAWAAVCEPGNGDSPYLDWTDSEGNSYDGPEDPGPCVPRPPPFPPCP